MNLDPTDQKTVIPFPFPSEQTNDGPLTLRRDIARGADRKMSSSMAAIIKSLARRLDAYIDLQIKTLIRNTEHAPRSRLPWEACGRNAGRIRHPAKIVIHRLHTWHCFKIHTTYTNTHKSPFLKQRERSRSHPQLICLSHVLQITSDMHWRCHGDLVLLMHLIHWSPEEERRAGPNRRLCPINRFAFRVGKTFLLRCFSRAFGRKK